MESSLFNLNGRTALVTGGSKGLGKAMAEALAGAGAEVILVSRSTSELQAAADEISSKTDAKVVCITADLSQRDEAKRVIEQALAATGKVDILINNAGTNTPQAIDEIDDATWDRLLELNLSSCMALSRAVVPGMKERRWGRIIHISSILGLASKPARNVYSATKSALFGLCRASALDLGAWGITVNCIAPGPFITDLSQRIFTREQVDVIAERTALGRWGQPHELAGPILLLASDAGSYITGSTLLVDGGTLSVTM